MNTIVLIVPTVFCMQCKFINSRFHTLNFNSFKSFWQRSPLQNHRQAGRERKSEVPLYQASLTREPIMADTHVSTFSIGNSDTSKYAQTGINDWRVVYSCYNSTYFTFLGGNLVLCL